MQFDVQRMNKQASDIHDNIHNVERIPHKVDKVKKKKSRRIRSLFAADTGPA